MNLLEKIQHSYHTYLSATFGLKPENLTVHQLVINVDENKQQFGDLNNTSAMVIAKQQKKNPREVAQQIVTEFKNEHIASIEIAGPGFLNFTLQPHSFQTLAQELFTARDNFFKLSSHEHKKSYNLEFVSANPTGPLHLGHGRGGIIGDALGTILRFLGHAVIKEFYINDAGAQMQKLANSFKIRCLQVLGHDVQLPEEAYHGEYLVELAHKAIRAYGSELLQKDLHFFEEYAKEHMLADIKQTLKDYGIAFDTWFSEKALHISGAIDKALAVLDKRGYLYTQEGATWFKSTDFGDDKDRVVRKATGELTYVSADIAYLYNKIERGADHLIMILGHDHHSYEIRLQSVRQALGVKEPLDIILYQLVKMKAGGEMVRMSKRAGNIVTLKDVIETVGTDVARFFYLNRKADAQLEFDLDLALKTTEENPVYYIQYAYVRINSIMEKAHQEAALKDISTQDLQHIGAAESFLLKKIVSLKELLMSISCNYQTHLLAYYTIELANAFHKYYAQARVLDSENITKTRARLALLQILQQQFARCFDLLGISKPVKM